MFTINMKVLTWIIAGLAFVATCIAIRKTSGYGYMPPLPPNAPSSGDLVNSALGYPTTSSVDTRGSPVGGDNIPPRDFNTQKYAPSTTTGVMTAGPGMGGGGGGSGGGGSGGGAKPKPSPKKRQGKNHRRYCVSLY